MGLWIKQFSYFTSSASLRDIKDKVALRPQRNKYDIISGSLLTSMKLSLFMQNYKKTDGFHQLITVSFHYCTLNLH